MRNKSSGTPTREKSPDTQTQNNNSPSNSADTPSLASIARRAQQGQLDRPDDVNTLQRFVGNRVVQRLLGRTQPKPSAKAVIQRDLVTKMGDIITMGGRGNYGGIGAALSAYHGASDDATRLSLLNTLIEACNAWMKVSGNNIINAGRAWAAVDNLLDDAKIEQRRLSALLPPTPTASTDDTLAATLPPTPVVADTPESTIPPPPGDVSSIPKPPEDGIPPPLGDSIPPAPEDLSVSSIPTPPEESSVPKPPGDSGPTLSGPSVPPGLTPPTLGAPTSAPTPKASTPSAKVAVSPYAVSRDALDAGSAMLADLLAARPQIVNNAKEAGSSSALSNCALATLAAIVGGKTTSEVSIDWQRSQGGRSESTAQHPDPKLQSEKMWAMMMLPADLEPLEAEGFVLKLDQPDFPEGKAYVIGDSQFYGMLNFLIQLAGARGSEEVSFKVHQHGEPGNKMWKEAELLEAMNGYPNGTQFATFVYSSAPGQAVRAHWVYAEKFNGTVIFADYQKNESKERRKGGFSLQSLGLKTTTTARQSQPHKDTPDATPAAAYLGMFPLSPDPGDSRKGLTFGEGCFIAFVPSFGSTPAVVADPEVDRGELSTILNSVQDRINIMRESRKVGTTDTQLPRNWGGGGGSMQLEIPSPALIEAEAIALAGSFGVSGAVSELGHLTNPDAIRIVGHPAVEVTTAAPGGSLFMQNLNASVKTIGADGGQTSGELPDTGRKYEVGSSIEGAVAGVGTIMAQATNQGIVFNAYLAQFTDIIHEALHTFERPSMPTALKEGTTEIFAGMLSNRILARGKDARFKYAYNPDYVRYILPVQELVEIFGIQTLADMYFRKDGTVKEFWTTKLNSRFPAAGREKVAEIVGNLTTGEDGFPLMFQMALADIKDLASGAPAPKAVSAMDTEYAGQQADLNEFLEEGRQSLLASGGLAAKPEAGLPDLTTSTDQTAIAARGSQAAANVRNEKILVMLYGIRDQATGDNYLDASKRIYHLENNIAKWTGETSEAVRERLVKPMRVVFEAASIDGLSGTEKLYLMGDASELSNNTEARALPMRKTGPNTWEVGVDTFLKRGTTLAYTLLAKGGDANRTIKTASITLPSVKEAKVSI